MHKYFLMHKTTTEQVRPVLILSDQFPFKTFNFTVNDYLQFGKVDRI